MLSRHITDKYYVKRHTVKPRYRQSFGTLKNQTLYPSCPYKQVVLHGIPFAATLEFDALKQLYLISVLLITCFTGYTYVHFYMLEYVESRSMIFAIKLAFVKIICRFVSSILITTIL